MIDPKKKEKQNKGGKEFNKLQSDKMKKLTHTTK